MQATENIIWKYINKFRYYVSDGYGEQSKDMHKFFCMVPAIRPSALQTLKGIIHQSSYY